MIVKKALVIGAGTMGKGIAQWFAQQEIHVELVDVVHEMAEKAQAEVHQDWERLQEKGKFTNHQINAFKMCLHATEMEHASPYNDLVIEAIIEDEKIKRELFVSLDKRMNSNCVFASNTSSIPITKIACDLSDDRKRRTLGLHFFNPAPVMKLVEVIKTNWVDDSVVNDMFKLFEENGKEPALCKDSPGFIVNRVARNFYGESLHILGQLNDDRIEEIDRVMTKVGGFRMGPFTLMDLIGIDVNYDVTQSVWNAFYNEPRFRPHKIQREMVESGRIGKKAQEGFYNYE